MASISKRGSKYLAQVMIDGKRRSKLFTRKSDANKWALEQEIAKKKNLDAASGMPISAFVDAYFSSRDLDRHSRASVLVAARHPLFSSLPIRAITTDHINEWIRLQEQGTHRVGGRPCKASSISRRLCSVSSFFNWALKRRLVETNPVTGHKKLEKVPHRERIASEEDIKALLRTADWDGLTQPKNSIQLVVAAFLLSCETGMRSNEMMQIQRSWINGDTLNIPKEVTKTNRSRNIALSNRAKELLSLVGSIGNAPEIFGLSGWSRDVMWRLVRDAADLGPVYDESGHLLREGLNFHDARATFCTWAASPGPDGAPRLDVMSLARQTGHSNLKMLMRYYRPKMGELVNRLNA